MVSCPALLAGSGFFITRLAAESLQGVPAIVWLAAAAPPVVWACLLCLLTRPGAAGMSPLVAALLAGAVLAAWPASQANQAVFGIVAGLAGDATARQIVPGFAVPLIEEVTKAAVIVLLLVMLPGWRLTIGGAAVMGAVVGLGFTGAENVQYLTLAAIQGGTTGLWLAIYVRGLLGGLQHATFAAFTAAGFAYARRMPTVGRRWLGVSLGLLAAVAQHILWNVCGARALTDTLCGAVQPGAACTPSPRLVALFVTAPLISLLSIGPAVAALYVIIRKLARSGTSSKP